MLGTSRSDTPDLIMQRILVTWIGRTDLRACAKDSTDDPGPVLRLLQSDQRFDRIHVLNDFSESDFRKENVESLESYLNWLKARSGLPDIAVDRHPSDNLHNNYARTFEFTAKCLTDIAMRYPCDATQFAFLLSPGTAAAQTAMLVASQTQFASTSVELLLTSKLHFRRSVIAGSGRLGFEETWL